MPKETRLVGGSITVAELGGVLTLVWSDQSGNEAVTIALNDESAAAIRKALTPARKPAAAKPNRAARRSSAKRARA